MRMMIKYTSILALSALLSACGSGIDTQADVATVAPIQPAGIESSVRVAPLPPIPKAGSYSNINNAQLEQMLKTGVILVDIRLEEEWKETGIIKDTNTITFFTKTGRINPDFMAQFTALVKPDQPVALICRTGNRTRAASQAIAKQLGYKKVYNVTHGIKGWIGEKRPVIVYQK